jgi:hypothetical protein
MKHLDLFLVALRDKGAHFRQDFPADCVPLCHGKVIRAIGSYVSP